MKFQNIGLRENSNGFQKNKKEQETYKKWESFSQQEKMRRQISQQEHWELEDSDACLQKLRRKCFHPEFSTLQYLNQVMVYNIVLPCDISRETIEEHSPPK